MSETLVRMPKLADTLVEGTLGQWLKKVGDTVAPGEPLASIETDKVTTELTSPAAGTLLEVLVAEGKTVPVETPIARIGAATDVAPGQGATRGEPPAAAESPARGTPLTRGEARAAADAPTFGRPPAVTPPVAPKPTPVAARLLAEHGLTPEQIASQSPGRLTKVDVLRHLEAASATRAAVLSTPGQGLSDTRPRASEASGGPQAHDRGPQAAVPSAPGQALSGAARASELIPLSSMRRAIAEHMVKARQTIPHGQTVMAADLTRLVAWRELHKQSLQEQEAANLTFTVFFVYALARALARNNTGPVDLGVAVALDAGLIVPVLRAADSLSLGATARGLADLAARARSNRLAPDATQGAYMTVTNVGSFGNLTASPIVPLGQVGILGPGLVERRPLPGPDGGIRPGWQCLLCLMFDRRALSDFAADRLLRRVVAELLAIPA